MRIRQLFGLFLGGSVERKLVFSPSYVTVVSCLRACTVNFFLVVLYHHSKKQNGPSSLPLAAMAGSLLGVVAQPGWEGCRYSSIFSSESVLVALLIIWLLFRWQCLQVD